MSEGHVLVLGGARSGKTGFAERLAMRAGSKPAYLATAEALDGEMRERVRTHREQRQGRFATIEEPLELTQAILRTARDHDVVLVDCLTLWVTNLMMEERVMADEFARLAAHVSRARANLVLVSNEVGLGIVPENRMAREFRDHAGRLHQSIAARARQVYFVAAGLPLKMKG